MTLENLFIVQEFKKAYIIAKKILRSKSEPLSCEIHDYFDSLENHNCIGCNLASREMHILNFLKSHKKITDIEESYSLYILRCYLLVECIYEIFRIVELPESYRIKHFKTFITIKNWANFFKHPKAFLLVHHPYYILENDKDEIPNIKKSIVIDTAFINKYYSGDKKNKELYKLLSNKKDVYVKMPKVDELTELFCNEFRQFVYLIRDNSVYRYILNDKATLEYFYEREDEIIGED